MTDTAPTNIDGQQSITERKEITEDPGRPRRKYWEIYNSQAAQDEQGKLINRAVLPRLRSGLGKEPGTVPAMWPYYTTLTDEGNNNNQLNAEHHALTFFGLHQQSQFPRLMHHPGARFAEALGKLHSISGGTEAADSPIDRRVNAMATATTFSELVRHMRGLIRQLADAQLGFDYNLLFQDLLDWQFPNGPATVRRHWGRSYFSAAKTSDQESA